MTLFATVAFRLEIEYKVIQQPAEDGVEIPPKHMLARKRLGKHVLISLSVILAVMIEGGYRLAKRAIRLHE